MQRIHYHTVLRTLALLLATAVLLIPSTAVRADNVAPSPSTSTVTTTRSSVPADGFSAAGVTVTLRDASGQPLSWKNVALTADHGSSAINADGYLTTGADGVVKFFVQDSVAEGPITYTATDTTDGITLLQTAQVTFTGVTASASDSRIMPAAGQSVSANGADRGYITVYVMDS